ncbi:hypothetical protein G9A89_001677 [Geosiphon pyriformis]|nr:hypothetical protein G9A89_001677 [Geosiphon pyriformis]
MDLMTYVPIAKLKKFTGKENNTQYQSLAAKLQTFQEFKIAFLGYFSNNSSINYLANTFTTIKQEETEAITTYLELASSNTYAQYIHKLSKTQLLMYKISKPPNSKLITLKLSI